MQVNRGVWTEGEHGLFLQAIQMYPNGPWRSVAEHVGTRDARQVQTHAQKYYEKINRHMRGLRKERRGWVRHEHRVEELPSPAFLSEATASSIPDRLRLAVFTDLDFHPLPYHQCGGDSIGSPQATDTYLELMLGTTVGLPTLEESLDMLIELFADS